MKHLHLLFFVLIMASACTKNQKTETLKLTILHTNDHHGRYWKDKKGRFGMSARQTLVKRIRNKIATTGGEVLLLSGGDINTGTPESDLFDAEPDFKGMNLLKYDAMAVGNHEFDNTFDILKKQEELANFPFLSANIYLKKDGKRAFKPYVIKMVKGFKIAIVGLTTEDTQNVALDKNIAPVEFKSTVEESKKLIPEIQKQEKPDMIIAVTHMGHYHDGNYGNKAPGDITLAKKVSGFDLIVGGHTQKPLFEPVKIGKTTVVQAGEWGKYLGQIDFEIQKSGDKSKVVLKNTQLIPVNYKDKTGKMGEKIPEDPDMLKLLSPYYQQAQEKMVEVIGKSECPLDGKREVVRSKQAPLGVLIARAQKTLGKADFAVVNGGGIRDSLPKGDIKLQDVYQVHPFGNTVVTAELNDAEILNFLQGATKRLGSGDNGAFPHFDGISFKKQGHDIFDIKINGERVESGKTYKVAINNFAAQGKEGYIDLREFDSYVDTGFSDAYALENFIKTQGINCEEIQPKFKL